MDEKNYDDVELLESTLNEINDILSYGMDSSYFWRMPWDLPQEEFSRLRRRKREFENELYHLRLLRDAADPQVVSVVSGTRRDT